ncbi:MAG: ABC transporter substrate-binding protein, partial [Mycobacteriaceae bacterium]
MKVRQTLGFLLIPVVVAGVVGCGRSSDSTGTVAGTSSAPQSASGDPTTDQTLGSPHRGGTMKIISQGFGSSIDPGIDYDGNWSLLRMTNDGLLTWKRVPGPEGNTLVPDLATEIPKPSEDGLTYEFTLRKGVKYSTGQEVKPSDFKATIERQYKLPGPVANFYSAIKGGAECEATPEAGK